MNRWHLVRDILLFIGGMFGIAYQLVKADVVEPSLTVVFAAMMGLPAAFWGDSKRRDNSGSKDG